MVNAIVLINARKGQVEAVAESLMKIDGISEVYSVAGRYDLVAIVRVREHEHLAKLISESIQQAPGLERTETLIAFRAYSRHDLESMFGLGLD
jgi:DNA-binding Lrp family transcriptional regulator